MASEKLDSTPPQYPIPTGSDGRYTVHLNPDGSETAVLADEGADSYEAAPPSEEGAAEYQRRLAEQQAQQADAQK